MSESVRCDQKFMLEALALARMGWGLTSPNPMVGAVIVRDGEIIGRGYHCKAGEPHAEINALIDVEKHGLDAKGATIYVTLEPCPMCSGAIIGARLTRLVYGAKDQKAGAVESVFKLFDERRVNHHTDVTAGVLEEDCLRMLRSFFVELRKSRGKSNG